MNSYSDALEKVDIVWTYLDKHLKSIIFFRKLILWIWKLLYIGDNSSTRNETKILLFGILVFTLATLICGIYVI